MGYKTNGRDWIKIGVIMALTVKDFSYYKDFVTDSISAHQKKMKEKNLPDQVIASYEGRLGKDMDNESIIENYLFIAVNTILPSLFYQVPRPTIRAKAGGSPFTAEILNGLVQAYVDDEVKRELQLCILDAYLPYGYGVLKVGYNSRRGKVQSSFLTGKTKGKELESMESDCEYLKFEKPILSRHSPDKTYLDHTQPFNKGQTITFEYTRTLRELKDSNLYSLSTNFQNHFKAQGEGDDRKIKLTIYEMWTMIDGFAWKLVYSPEWHEELQWGKSLYTELPVSLLQLNPTPDRLYVTSHGSLGFRAQKELDYLNQLWKSHIDHLQRKHFVDMTGLTENGIKSIKANVIDAIVECNRTPSTVYQQAVSQPMGADAYANIENTRQYLNLLLSTTGGRGGDPDAKLATTEKSKQAGDLVRASGLQDYIRDWMRNVIRKLTKNVIDFGSPELTIEITNKDVSDPVSGEMITGQKLKVGGEDGFPLRGEGSEQNMIGDTDLDYIYDIDMTSASRPDYPVIRKQLAEAIQLGVSMRPLLMEKGKDIAVDEMLEDYFDTFDVVPNPQKYIVDMTEEEKIALQQQQMMAQQQEMLQNTSGEETKRMQGQGVPQEQQIASGAERVGL